LRRLDDTKIQARIDDLIHGGACHSDDPHVIAVVLESGCRLVFTRDTDLHRDLRNRDIVNPVASIYQNRTHRHLLTECHCM
jgi:rRNA-processing protein FCF1